MNSIIKEPIFKPGDRIQLSEEGLKIKAAYAGRGASPKTPWPKRRGQVAGRGAIKAYPELFTIKWDDLKTKEVIHQRFIEHEKIIQEAPAGTL